MSEAKDFLEHMEHAGHSGHGEHGHGGDAHKGPGRQIGITMAILGVMLALCAALVGSHRTELIKTTVEQSNRWGIYQAETMKYRMAEGNYDMLMALSPDKEEEKKLNETLREKSKPGGGQDDPDTAEIKDLIVSSMDDLADLLTPEQSEKDAFKKLKAEYKADMKDAKEDAEAYEPAIKAHEDAAEWYERAQLLAEVGIVVASIALLLSSRAVWLVSVLFGLGGGLIIGTTFVRTRGELQKAEANIEEALKREVEVEKADEEADEKAEGKAEGAEKKTPGGEKKEEGKPDEKKDEKPAPSTKASTTTSAPSTTASATSKPTTAPSTKPTSKPAGSTKIY